MEYDFLESNDGIVVRSEKEYKQILDELYKEGYVWAGGDDQDDIVYRHGTRCTIRYLTVYKEPDKVIRYTLSNEEWSEGGSLYTFRDIYKNDFKKALKYIKNMKCLKEYIK